TAADGHEHVGQGLKVCESTLALYQVLERDDWQDQPAWRRLPTAEQKALAEEARDLLLLLAQARAHLASSPMRPEVSRLAGAFLVSLGCTPQAGTPSALTALSALGSERTAAEQLRDSIGSAHREALALLKRAEAIPGLEPSPALWEARALYLERLGD